MNFAWEMVTDIAKDMPGGLPVFFAILFVVVCAAFTFMLEILLAIYRTRS